MQEPTVLPLKSRRQQHIYIELITLVILYGLGYFLSTVMQFGSGFLLMAAGVFAYFYYSAIGERSFLKLNAMFSGVWLFTIGLAQMRLLRYQAPWEVTTWVSMCLAHLAFLTANKFAHHLFPALNDKFKDKWGAWDLSKKYRIEKIKRNPDFYFWLATFWTVVGVGSFLANVAIKGYIPLFEIGTNPSAYVDFYTRFEIFYVASTASAGLSYLAAVKLPLSRFRKLVLFIYIVILVFIIPILLVQRGTFVNAALILLAAVYLPSNRRFWVLIVEVIVILGIYMVGSSTRGYSEAQLDVFFQPSSIVISEPVAKPNPKTDTTSSTDPTQEGTKGTTFALPGKAAFLVSYFTIGHDNFNSAVLNKTYNTWGLRQIKPFNVILRSKTIDHALEKAEAYVVQPHLNTYNLISLSYYDFGVAGVVGLMLLWSFGFGLVEAFYYKYKGMFSNLLYGVCLIPITLNFFEAWMSNFTIWLFFGTILIMYLPSAYTIKKKSQ